MAENRSLIERLSDSPLLYREERCITLGLMDRIHKRKEGAASAAFLRHRDRLIEGRHFFRISRKELGELTYFGAVNSTEGNPNIEVILLTERGYLLLVKTFNDDFAWEVQEKLVDDYFRNHSPSCDDPMAFTPWSKRIALTIAPHRAALRAKHPGWWSIFSQTVAEMMVIETEFSKQRLTLKFSDLPDGSIGQCWSHYREETGVGGTVYNDVVLKLPDRGIEVFPKIYHPSELPMFASWLDDRYFPEKFVGYSLNKFKAPELALAAAKASENTCNQLSSKPIMLPKKVRRELIGVKQPMLFD